MLDPLFTGADSLIHLMTVEFEDIVVYIYLETVVPKLAHYYGYLLGNELLPCIIPGYHTIGY